MARHSEFDELDDKPSTTKKHRPRRGSFFGFLSVVAGGAALAVVYRDQISEWLTHRYLPFVKYDMGQLSQYLYQVKDYQVQAYHVAAAGAGLAVWALLWRKLLGRTRAGWPVLGLLVCASAAGIYRYNSVDRTPGTPEYWVQVNVVERVQKMFEKKPEAPRMIETAAPVPAPDLAPAAPVVEPEAKPATPPAPAQKKEEGSKLFPGL
ncbi:hypothetical protein IPV69_12875 [Humisphaera borealis]|uniref:Uncharacterized protein n=2 Tax=Humisphaera borealis TaxID=2807512 RepID=A0A7M2X3I8_9BACT|nr:hypothetical protein IPV69_12875 [Humisphaera borealis]